MFVVASLLASTEWLPQVNTADAREARFTMAWRMSAIVCDPRVLARSYTVLPSVLPYDCVWYVAPVTLTHRNDGTLITVGYDHVKPSHYPEKWNLPALFAVSIVLGMVACGSSLLLLWAALDSWNPDGLFAKMGLPGMTYGKLTTLIYLKVGQGFLRCFVLHTAASNACILAHGSGLASTHLMCPHDNYLADSCDGCAKTAVSFPCPTCVAMCPVCPTCVACRQRR